MRARAWSDAEQWAAERWAGADLEGGKEGRKRLGRQAGRAWEEEEEAGPTERKGAGHRVGQSWEEKEEEVGPVPRAGLKR